MKFTLSLLLFVVVASAEVQLEKTDVPMPGYDATPAPPNLGYDNKPGYEEPTPHPDEGQDTTPPDQRMGKADLIPDYSVLNPLTLSVHQVQTKSPDITFGIHQVQTKTPDFAIGVHQVQTKTPDIAFGIHQVQTKNPDIALGFHQVNTKAPEIAIGVPKYPDLSLGYQQVNPMLSDIPYTSYLTPNMRRPFPNLGLVQQPYMPNMYYNPYTILRV